MERQPGAYNSEGKRSAEYTAFTNMRARCRNPRREKWEHYGGRGIGVCQRWLVGENSVSPFQCFLADMGLRPSPQHSLDRKDVNGDYTPENCRWATPIEQTANRRMSAFVDYKGERIALSLLCRRLGAHYLLTFNRIFILNWAVEDALTRPRVYTKPYKPRKKKESITAALGANTPGR